MHEQQSSPAATRAFAGVASGEAASTIAPSAGADLGEAELADADLEHVVGGLARAWLSPIEGPSSEGDGGAGSNLPLDV